MAALGLLGCLCLPACAQTGSEKKRRDPPPPPVLVVGDTRFEAPLLGTPFGYRQDGGILVARHAATGDLQWSRRVYEPLRDAALESDKQDVFIQRITLSADGQRLVVVNEHGQVFELNLDGGGLRRRP